MLLVSYLVLDGSGLCTESADVAQQYPCSVPCGVVEAPSEQRSAHDAGAPLCRSSAKHVSG